MKDSGIEWVGDIPGDWNIIKIKYVLQERVENNSPIRTKNILSLTAQQGVVPIAEKTGGGNKPKEDYSDYRLAYPGDIVMNSMNILSGSVGLSKYFGCVSPVYYMLRPRDKNFDVRFFNYIFQSTVFQKSLYGLGNGILMKESGNGKLNTIRMRIPMDKFGSLYIPVAPVEEQKRIAEFLDKKCGEIDGLIADIKTQVQTLEQYKRSVITEAVTKGLNPSAEMKDSGAGWMPFVPAHWLVEKIKYHLRIRGQKNMGDRQVLSLYRDYGVIPKDSRDDNHNVTSEDTSTYRFVRVGDFVVNKMKAWQGSVAVSQYEGIVSPAYYVYEFTDNLFNKRYFHYLLRNKTYTTEFMRLSGGIRVGQWDLPAEAFENTVVLLPPADEQKEITDYLDNKCAQIEELISAKQSQIEALESYKKSLIYEFVTGKKEVV